MQNKNFKYIDDWAIIRLVDSFVKINKSGTGNGEAALYLGSKFDPDIFRFFGCEDFTARCIITKNDFLEYLDDVKIEYIHHRCQYRNEVSINTWHKFREEIQLLPEEMFFDLTRKRQKDKNGRVYAQEITYKRAKDYSISIGHKAYVYDLIRRIAIPEVSFIMLIKMEDDQNIDFHAKLYYDPNVEKYG